MNTTNNAILADTNTMQDEQTKQYLTFKIDDREFGVDIMKVVEVKGWTDTTRLPNSPDYVRGVLNLRGIIVPIFDLRKRFDQVLTDASSYHVVIILTIADRTVGILVDMVSDIITCSQADIKPAPEMDANSTIERYIDGLITKQDYMVILLDLEKILDVSLIEKDLDAKQLHHEAV